MGPTRPLWGTTSSLRPSGLPEENRIAYILKDIEKLPEDQVAQILGTNRTTMKNRVHRARLVIRKRVEDHFFKKSNERIS